MMNGTPAFGRTAGSASKSTIYQFIAMIKSLDYS